MSIPNEVYDFMSSSKFVEAENLLRCNLVLDDIGAHYLLSELLIRNQKYEHAVEFLTKVINLSIQQKDRWYVDVAYLLRSYCYAKTNDRSLSLVDLKRVELLPNMSITWLLSEGIIDPNKIRKINNY